MKDKTKGYLFLGAIVVLGGLTFFIYHDDKKRAAKTIAKYNGASSYGKLLTMDKAYLIAWAKGLKKGNEQFSYQGKNYNTAGGAAVK